MVNEPRSRGDLLKEIKSAENIGTQREENARARVLQIKATAQNESSKIVEEAEKEGRVAMRKAIEAAKAKCAATKDTQVSAALVKAREMEALSSARIPVVADLMYLKFKKEHDVKD